MVDERLSQTHGRDTAPGIDLKTGLEQSLERGTDLALRSRICEHLRAKRPLWLFLDYDGTLVPIARTPDQAKPDGPLLRLLADLASLRNIRIVILSGRPLFSLQSMLRVPGLMLAGVYGVEIQMPDGRLVQRADPQAVREVIDEVKKGWAKLIDGAAGFLLEDKGMAVALHSRLADPSASDWVEPRAADLVQQAVSPDYRILGGEHFIEIAPSAANKGQTVRWLLEQDSTRALSVYFGDDDKDEDAFAVIREFGGIPCIVGTREPNTRALVRLADPAMVREWLIELLKAGRSPRGDPATR